MATPGDVFETVYKAEYRRLQGFLRKRLNNPEDAADLSQEIWARFYHSLSQNGAPEHARGLVYTIARNLLIDHYRAKARQRLEAAGEVPEAADPDALPDLEERQLEALRWEALKKGIENLSPKHQQAILEIDLKGKTFKDLAQETDEKMGTWLSRNFYAKKKLRKYLTALYEELIEQL